LQFVKKLESGKAGNERGCRFSLRIMGDHQSRIIQPFTRSFRQKRSREERNELSLLDMVTASM